MSKDLLNIDKLFNQSFNNWEAPHTPSEMNSGWNNISQNIPHANVPHSPPGSSSIFTNPANLLKLVGLGGAAVAVTVAAVLTYNHYTSAKNTEQGHASEVSEVKRPVTPPEKPLGQTIPAPVKKANVQPKEYVGKQWQKSGINTPRRGAVNSESAKSSQQSSAGSSKYTPAQNQGPAIHQNITQSPAATTFIPATSDLHPADTSICAGKEIIINEFKVLASIQGTVSWGDGSAVISVTHKYEKAGTYIIRGTGNGFSYSRSVTVILLPIAKFIDAQYNGLVCHFKNYSANAVNYVWDFGDGSPDEPGKDVEHAYHQEGEYHASLIAVNALGCIDSFSKDIYVSAHKKIDVPNVITPDGDGVNDEFKVTIEGETFYVISITDAEGRLVFQSSDKNSSWNGTEGGKPCQAGTYFYVIKYQFIGDDRPTQKTGTITLIR